MCEGTFSIDLLSNFVPIFQVVCLVWECILYAGIHDKWGINRVNASGVICRRYPDGQYSTKHCRTTFDRHKCAYQRRGRVAIHAAGLLGRGREESVCNDNYDDNKDDSRANQFYSFHLQPRGLKKKLGWIFNVYAPRKRDRVHCTPKAIALRLSGTHLQNRTSHN